MRWTFWTYGDDKSRSSTRLVRAMFGNAAFLLASAIPIPCASTGSCTDYSRYVHLVGSAKTPGTARAVDRAGIYAYVADGYSGVHIFDVSYPPNPVLRGMSTLT